MTKIPFFARWVLMLSVFSFACGSDNPETKPESNNVMDARNVRLSIPTKSGNVYARSDNLEIGKDGKNLILKGNASINIVGSSTLSVRADRMELNETTLHIHMNGNVKAVFPGPKLEGINADSGI